MRRAQLSLSFLVLFFFSITGLKVEAANIPDPVGDIYVQDFAHVLSADEKNELIELGRYLDDHTQAQIAVLTVNSLENESVEEYALQAFRQYGLGSTEKDNGVLLLLAPQDSKIKVEVGYGLEGALPDGKVGRILDSYALPYLEQNEINLAITNTYKQLFNEVSKEYNLDKQVEAEGIEYNQTEGLSPLAMLILILMFAGIIFLDFRFLGGAFTLTILRMLAAVVNRGGGGGPRSGGGGSSGGGGASRSW
ncbi:TPM domain-containing protein [Siminovitchia fortis]|uniref:TPM domain-containing protein n=1 Tax=Siminovitchia fortis TaxID=254758 RepID=A0A443IPH9_9BACI|nr:TPM domain-containing protein [Siminovitchia fortis]RWR08468.1 TPM domain-containing protein [Siminovitchia fortis]WHY83678.1 TPM domain-containing protein [Siminovitchia fortis]